MVKGAQGMAGEERGVGETVAGEREEPAAKGRRKARRWRGEGMAGGGRGGNAGAGRGVSCGMPEGWRKRGGGGGGAD